MEHVIDGVLYRHGTGSSGKDAAFNLAVSMRRSVVIGHTHTFAGAKYHANDNDRVFGLNVGCGIDIDEYAFAYGQFHPNRPMLGCGIIIDGTFAAFEPMPCGKKERYYKGDS